MSRGYVDDSVWARAPSAGYDAHQHQQAPPAAAYATGYPGTGGPYPGGVYPTGGAYGTYPSPTSAPYPGHHHSTTVMHTSARPTSDADIYKVGIYGWRKRCLYVFVLILTIVIVLNLALTAWIILFEDGMGALKIEEEGIRVTGRAHFDKPVHFSQLSTARDEALLIDSSRGVSLQARNLSGAVSSRLSLGSDGRATAVCDKFEVYDSEHKLLFSADSDEIGLKLPNLRILDDGGSVFEGAIQTAFVRPEPDTPLRLESPTRSVVVDAAQDIELLSGAGEVNINSLLDIKLTSKQGSIRLEAGSIFVEGAARSPGRGNPQMQLCACQNGRLFLANQGADCRAERHICE